ncbi:MAG: CRISPR-associated endonuclease Cas1 [Proteobacteria bacterium]|nr:CRISPR-associated endonuclease Cas1 [Pseudomonadota bacterium]
MQLVINSPGTYLSQKDEIFRLKQGEKRLDVSPLKVESIILTNKALITTKAVQMALEHNVDLIFLDDFGDPLGRVWFSKMGSTVLIRRKQLEASETDKGLNLAIDMIRTKLENQARFLKKLMNARPKKETVFEDPLRIIDGAMTGLNMVALNQPDIQNSIMGFEGTAGRAYFQCISKIMPETYQFKGRSRRPAKDPFNAVLNYCYGILYGRIEKACILAGLDPYIGFLHADNYNKKSLVFDLIEPFRIFAEQTAIYLFTGKKIRDEYFDLSETSATLNQKGKPVVVDAINQHLEETVRYRKRNVKRKHLPQHEAHRLANILLADEPSFKKPEWLEIVEF